MRQFLLLLKRPNGLVADHEEDMQEIEWKEFVRNAKNGGHCQFFNEGLLCLQMCIRK